MDVDKFALFVFEDGLAEEPVTFIESYDPATHNSATWPKYKDASQKKNWVRVNWPNADRFGKATGTTTPHAAQVVLFGATRNDLQPTLEKMLADSESSDKPAVKRAPKIKCDTVEDKILKKIRFDLQGQRKAAYAASQVVEVQEQRPRNDERQRADERAQRAEERAQQAEERAEEAEQRVERAEQQIDQLQGQLQEAEERVVQAETKAAFALLDLLPNLQELPRLVRALEQPIAAAAAAPVHQGGGVSELHKFGDILVPQAKLDLLRGKSASLYTQELAVLVFGKETLEDCCLTGSTSKGALPTAAVNDIIVHVMGKFKGENVVTVRSFLRRKCNNAAFHKKRSPAE